MTDPTPRRRRARRHLAGLALLLLVLDALLGPVAADAGAGEATPPAPRRVLVVSIPRLAWTDIDGYAEDLPHLRAFLRTAAVGDLSLRTIGPRTSLGEGYLTIGAGNRATVRDADAGRVLAPTERFEDGSAAASYHRRTGLDAPKAAALQLSIPAIDALADRMLYGAQPGALTEELEDHGWSTAVIGNADVDDQGVPDPDAPTGEPNEEQPFGSLNTGSEGQADGEQVSTEPLGGENRPAALAVMDHDGRVAKGEVRRRLLRRDPASPYGLRLNGSLVTSTLEKVWTDRTLALVELSDLERADRYAGVTTKAQGTKLWERALRQTDDLLGRVLDQAGDRDLVVLVTPAARRRGEVLSPFAVRGAGFDGGVLRSGTTRRYGYVTLPDIAPTILKKLDITKPNSMNGAPMAQVGDGHDDHRWTQFIGWNELTKFRDRVAGGMGFSYGILQVIGYAAAIWALTRKPNLRSWVGLLALVTIALLPLTFATGYVRYDKLGAGLYQVVLVAGALVLAVGARWLGRRLARGDETRAALIPPVLLIALTWLVLLLDIVSGGQAQINTIFGYSPIVAGRFAGFGNSAYGIFAMSAVVLAAAGWGILGGPRPSGRTRNVLLGAVALVFVVTIVADGHPNFGSDVGGVLSLVPTAGLVILLLRDKPIKVRTVVAIVAATLVVIGIFAAIDLSRPDDQQTHLARLVHETFGGGAQAKGATGKGDGGGKGFLTTIDRKLSANLNSVTGSSFSTLFPATVLFLAFAVWRRTNLLRWLKRTIPGMRALLWGGVAACILGDVVNDSGISVPAMMFPILLSFLIYVVMALDPPQDEIEPPARAS